MIIVSTLASKARGRKQASKRARASTRNAVIKTGDVVRVAVAGQALGGTVLEDGALAHGTQGCKQKREGDEEEHLGDWRISDVEKSWEVVV